MKILVTGASSNSFLGKHVVQQLQNYDYELITPDSKTCNLTNQAETHSYFSKTKPDVIIHLGAFCGGIKKNIINPGRMVYENTMMGLNVYDCAVKYEAKHLICLGSVCMYPKYCKLPFREDDILNGASEESNKPYSDSKRLLLTLHEAYRKQYNLNSTFLIPINLYGPEDHFDLENSHVIPALVNKFCHAVKFNEHSVYCWGTGTGAYREFLYVEDCAEAIVKSITSNLDTSLPINLGTGIDISIKDLADLIAELTEFKGNIVFTGDVSDGQPRRRLDTSRAKELLGFEAKTNLREGLIKTINWYKENYGNRS